MIISDIRVKCDDGRIIHARQFETLNSKGGFVLINSALGVRQEFYTSLAKYFVSTGKTVMTWDGRGIGKSADPSPKFDNAKMRDWGQVDLNAILNYIVSEKKMKWEDIVVVGHSAGAHLVGLCSLIVNVPKIIMIASGTCHWSLYEKKYRAKMMLAWFVLFPLSLKLFGYIPRSLGLGCDIPSGIISDWRKWSLNREYLFSDISLGKKYYDDYNGEIRFIRFTDDYTFSPRLAVEDLMSRFPNATTDLRSFSPKDLNVKSVGHFGFFSKKNMGNWEEIFKDI